MEITEQVRDARQDAKDKRHARHEQVRSDWLLERNLRGVKRITKRTLKRACRRARRNHRQGKAFSATVTLPARMPLVFADRLANYDEPLARLFEAIVVNCEQQGWNVTGLYKVGRHRLRYFIAIKIEKI